MSNATQQFVKLIVASMIGLSIPVLGYIALEADASVAWAIIAGSLVAMAILLDKLEDLAAAFEAWRQ